MIFSIAADMPWGIGMMTCRLIPNYNVYGVLLMNCFEEVRPSMLQESAKGVAGKGHWGLGAVKIPIYSGMVKFARRGPLQNRMVICTSPEYVYDAPELRLAHF